MRKADYFILAKVLRDRHEFYLAWLKRDPDNAHARASLDEIWSIRYSFALHAKINTQEFLDLCWTDSL